MSAFIPCANLPDERRAYRRVSAVVPASVRAGDRLFTAKLENITANGAMLETNAPVLAGAIVLMTCGTVAAYAEVIWSKAGRVGIKFQAPLSHAEVDEQLSRSAAIEARRSVGHARGRG